MSCFTASCQERNITPRSRTAGQSWVMMACSQKALGLRPDLSHDSSCVTWWLSFLNLFFHTQEWTPYRPSRFMWRSHHWFRQAAEVAWTPLHLPFYCDLLWWGHLLMNFRSVIANKIYIWKSLHMLPAFTNIGRGLICSWTVFMAMHNGKKQNENREWVSGWLRSLSRKCQAKLVPSSSGSKVIAFISL